MLQLPFTLPFPALLPFPLSVTLSLTLHSYLLLLYILNLTHSLHYSLSFFASAERSLIVLCSFFDVDVCCRGPLGEQKCKCITIFVKWSADRMATETEHKLSCLLRLIIAYSIFNLTLTFHLSSFRGHSSRRSLPFA